jgi:hypothetical protein
MRRAFEKAAELVGWETAIEICSTNPGLVADGQEVVPGRRQTRIKKRGFTGWFTWRKAG